MSLREKLTFAGLAITVVLTPFSVGSVLDGELHYDLEGSKDLYNENEDVIKERKAKKKKEIKLHKKKGKERIENKYHIKITFQNRKIIIKEDNLQIPESINNLINETKELEQIIQKLEKESYSLWSEHHYGSD